MISVKNKSKKSLDVALWCPAIRTHYWLKQYEDLANHNKCTFKIFYCGQKRPTPEEREKFPENLIYIYSPMPTITAHAEIARRHAMGANSKYVMLYSDDMYAYPGMLDYLVEEMENYGGEMVVGPAFRPVLEGQKAKRAADRFINLHVTRDTFFGTSHPLILRKTAGNIGGLDKRFKGPCFDRDYFLRLYSYKNIPWKTVEKAKIAEDMDQQFPSLGWGKRASVKYTSHDWNVAQNIWQVKLKKFDGKVKRKKENIFFEDDSLLYELG